MDELLPILKRLQEKFYGTFDEKALLTFVEPMGCRYANGNAPNPVSQSIQGFLENAAQQTLLIQGAPGSGKTLLSQVEAHHRWQQLNDNLVKKEQLAPRVIPLWIWLPALLKEAKGKDLLAIFLDKQGLVASEIQSIQQANQKDTLSIQLMLDGWDEVPVQDIELFTANGWWDKAWPHIKLIVTSRPEILAQYAGKHPGGYPSFFCQGNLQDNSFTECYLQPFAAEQIHGYLEQYIKTTLPLKEVVILPPSIAPNACDIPPDANALLCWEEVATYEHYITTLPGVTALAQVPFVLTLLAQVLPRIVLETQSHTETEDNTSSRQALTHDTLYDHFTRQWLHRQACRLWENHSVKETLIRVMNIPEGAIPQGTTNDEVGHYQFERLKTCLRIYSENLAKAAFNLGQGKLDVLLDETVTLHPDLVGCDIDGTPFFKAASLNTTLMEMIRSGCLLKSQEAGKHVFLHKTLLEFFAAARLYRSVCTAIDWYVGSLSEDVIQEEFSFNAYSLTQEPKIITFLAEKVIANTAFKEHLYQVIEFSKQEPVVATASSNAITILNAARESFAQKNFSGVRIPGANLAGALCSHTDFSYADCRRVDFSGAWLRSTDFSSAYLVQSNFGELTAITMKTLIVTVALSPDERWLALGDSSHDVTIWDMEEEQSHNYYIIPFTQMKARAAKYMVGSLMNPILGVEGMMFASTALAFTADSENLLVVNAEHVLYSISLSTQQMVQKFSLWPPRAEHLNFLHFMHDLEPRWDTFMTTDSDIAYTHDELDGYYHILSSGEHKGELFKDEIFLCKSSDSSHWLTYHKNREQQILWNMQKGFAERQEVFAIAWKKGEFSYKTKHLTISQDNQSWVFMSFDRKNGEKPSQCLQWVIVNNPVPKPLSQLLSTELDEIGFVFGTTSDTLVICTHNYTGLWDLVTQKKEREFCLPTENKVSCRLWVNRRYNQLLYCNETTLQLRRYDFCISTAPGENITKSYFLQTICELPQRDELVFNIPNKDTFVCHIAQQKITFPNLNHVTNIQNEQSLIHRIASSDVYLALPYGYWDKTGCGICAHMMTKERGLRGKVANIYVNGDREFFQKMSVVLRFRQHSSVGLTLGYSVPIAALSFSQNSCYLAGLDGLLNVILWKISINHKSLKLRIVRVWRVSSGIGNMHYLRGDILPNIAVQQQGIVVASALECLSLLYTSKKKPISVAYDVGIPLSSLTFADDITLVCETKNKGSVVFQLMEIEKEYRLSPIYSSEKYFLQLQNCKIAGVLGITSSQNCLFKHYKAVGQPANLEIEDNTALTTTFAQGQWFSQINGTKVVIPQSFYSQLLTSALIDYDNWVVTLVRDVNAKDGMHTFLLIEGITTFGKPCYVRMDLANRIGGKKVEPEGFAKIKFAYTVAENFSQQSLQQTLTSVTILRRNPEGLKGQAWVVSRRQLVVLIEHIQQHYVIPDKLIPYSTLGDKSFFAKGHNCYTWAREMLLCLNHPPITKRLPKKWSNYIVNNPGFDLNLQLGAVAAQKDNSSNIVPDNSGLGSRQCALM